MAWQQLIKPTLPGTGEIGYCLKYARQRYGINSKYDTAWAAWEGAKYKHADRDIPDVIVPVWFKYPFPDSSPGHVGVRTPDGKIYSSPYKSSQQYYIFSSISEVESTLNAKYVGWSEDINGVRVVKKGEDMANTTLTKDQQKALFKGFFGADWLGSNYSFPEETLDSWLSKWSNNPDALWKQPSSSGNCTEDERAYLDLLKKIT